MSDANPDASDSGSTAASCPFSTAESLSPAQTLIQLRRVFGGVRETKDSVVELIREGDLRLYASKYWALEGAKLGECLKFLNPADAEENVLVDPNVFEKGTRLNYDKERWQWKKGNFFVRHGRKKRMMMKSCRISREDVDEILRAHFLLQVSERGRHSDAGRRDQLWLRLIEIAVENGVAGFQSNQGAREQVHQKLTNPDDPGAWGRKDASAADPALKEMIAKVRGHFGIGERTKPHSD